MASRWVRYWSLHGKLAAVLAVTGWTLVALADVATPVTTISGPDSLEIVKLILGGAVLLFGFQAGFTAWIINPAIDRKLASHRKEAADYAHSIYVPRLEWDQKHGDLARKVDDSQRTILEAIAGLKRGRGGHE